MTSDWFKLLWRFVFLLLVFSLSLSCSGGAANSSTRAKAAAKSSKTPKTARGTFKPYTIAGKTYYPLKHAAGYSEVGHASWYGPGFHGKRTSNGEKYDMHAMTAAHKILPMNTTVKVTNLENGRSVVVRINDRGPFVAGRVIDMSKAGAHALGMHGRGTAKVRVENVGAVAGMTETGNISGRFYVQVGAFQEKRNAERLLARLKRIYPDSRLHHRDVDGAFFWRVHLGVFPSLDRAREELVLLKKAYPGAFVIGE